MLLKRVWALIGWPCGKYFVVMLPIWLPLLRAAGDLDRPFATPATVAETEAMSAATIDRYLALARRSMQLRGISTTTPLPLLRNSIGLSKAGDERPPRPGRTPSRIAATLIGEFARTLTTTDLVTGWTENASATTRRNGSSARSRSCEACSPSRCACSIPTTGPSSSTTTSPVAASPRQRPDPVPPLQEE